MHLADIMKALDRMSAQFTAQFNAINTRMKGVEQNQAKLMDRGAGIRVSRYKIRGQSCNIRVEQSATETFSHEELSRRDDQLPQSTPLLTLRAITVKPVSLIK